MVQYNSYNDALNTPTTPKKKVWQLKNGNEGVPSMFAGMQLSKPLKINKVASPRFTPSPAGRTTAKLSKAAIRSIPEPAIVPANTTADTSDVKPIKSDKPMRKTNKITSNTQKAKELEAPRTPITNTTKEVVKINPKTLSGTQNRTFIPPIARLSSPTNTPSPLRKPKVTTRFSGPSYHQGQESEERMALNAKVDALIPEMYRKKAPPAVDKETEQAYREIAWELHLLEEHRKEEAIRKDTKDISQDVARAMAVLNLAKQQNDKDDYDDDSDGTPKRGASNYQDRMKAKLSHFNSDHSSSSLSYQYESSSVSSSDSDEDDGLFRGY